MMKILTQDNGITVTKENKTKVCYYLFDEYEIHLNVIPPHTKQEWHYHSCIEETILVQSGILTCEYIENEKQMKTLVYENELVQVHNSLHTFSNESDNDIHMVVFRFVPTGKNQREVMKNDKVIVEVHK